jgi:hypothetical protein
VHREEADEVMEGMLPFVALGGRHLVEQFSDPGVLRLEQLHYVGALGHPLLFFLL